MLRAIYGTGGSFLPGARAMQGVLSFSCSRAGCLAKTDSTVSGGTSSAPAPSGPAMIAFDSRGAILYFPRTRQFARWVTGKLADFDLPAFDASGAGEILSIGIGPSQALQLAVRRGDGVWIVSSDGSILDSLPSETAAVLLLPSGVVYALPDALVLRRADRSEIRFSASGVNALFSMGAGYIEARSPSAIYALRIDAGREGLFVLPEPRRKQR